MRFPLAITAASLGVIHSSSMAIGSIGIFEIGVLSVVIPLLDTLSDSEPPPYWEILEFESYPEFPSQHIYHIDMLVHLVMH